MKSIKKTASGAGNLEFVGSPTPRIKDDEILCRVLATAICGTDLHLEDWNDWAQRRLTPPTIIGHEFAGQVVEVGSKVQKISVGDVVSAESHVACHSCDMCEQEQFHVCRNTRIIGVHQDGCFAEYVAIPAENAWVCPGKQSVDVTAIMEPLGVAVHAMCEFPVKEKNIVITGCGPIGLMAVAIAKHLGAASIFAVEINSYRSDLARHMGADLVINPIKADTVREILGNTKGFGADVVVDFSGSAVAQEMIPEYIRPEGKIVIAGLPSNPVTLNMSELATHGVNLKGIAGRLMFESWERMGLMLRNGLDITPVITHHFSLEQYAQGFKLMRDGFCGKVLLTP
ncbi:MAG: L-threonine 3-dehydrogenase [Anaerolineaceae bacterium]